MSVRGSGMRKEVYCSSSRALCAQRAGAARRSRITRSGQERASKEQGVVKVRLGRAGEGARKLFPWTAGPGAKKNLDPEHPLARDSRGRSLAILLYLIQFVSCPSSLTLCISHPLPIPRGPPCLRVRVNVYECRGGKRSKVSPRGALNLPAARFPAN
jgi:hypothetical protein